MVPVLSLLTNQRSQSTRCCISRASGIELWVNVLNDLLKGVNLFLIGMMGSGKSTVGKILAERLSYRFFDTDAVIEQSTQQSISKIFAESGESAFRQLETEVLSQLSAYTRLAIATGGGIVVERENWSYLHHGIVVWLDAPADLLYERLKHDTTRPLLQTPNPTQTLDVILNQRRSLYAQADLRVAIASDQAPTQVADHILNTLPSILKSASSASPPNRSQ